MGFRLGKYKGGTCAVVEPFDTIHIPLAVRNVVKAFQGYIRYCHFLMLCHLLANPDTRSPFKLLCNIFPCFGNSLLAILFGFGLQVNLIPYLFVRKSPLFTESNRLS